MLLPEFGIEVEEDEPYEVTDADRRENRDAAGLERDRQVAGWMVLRCRSGVVVEPQRRSEPDSLAQLVCAQELHPLRDAPTVGLELRDIEGARVVTQSMPHELVAFE